MLRQALQEPPVDGSLWNRPKVAQWMSEDLERPIHPQRGWEYLLRFEMGLKVPRPAHDKGDITEQEQWKKKLNQKVQEVGQKYPGAAVEVWAMDEHPLGLKPISTRVWAQLGEQPFALALRSKSPMLTGNTNGYGYMALLIQKGVKLTTGFYQKLI